MGKTQVNQKRTERTSLKVRNLPPKASFGAMCFSKLLTGGIIGWYSFVSLCSWKTARKVFVLFDEGDFWLLIYFTNFSFFYSSLSSSPQVKVWSSVDNVEEKLS